jgi:hypothetical protein
MEAFQPLEEKDSKDVTWYHEGPDSLKVAREWIASECCLLGVD